MLRRKEERASREPTRPFVPRLGPDSPLRNRVTDAPVREPKRRETGGSEHSIQAAFIAKVDDPANQRRWPELAFFHAIPNGGKRMPAVAAKLNAEGLRPGVPDTHLPVARGGYLSLWIEFKRPGGTTTPEQSHWMSALQREGHKVALHTTAEGAWLETMQYLSEPRTQTITPLNLPKEASSP